MMRMLILMDLIYIIPNKNFQQIKIKIYHQFIIINYINKKQRNIINKIIIQQNKKNKNHLKIFQFI